MMRVVAFLSPIVPIALIVLSANWGFWAMVMGGVAGVAFVVWANDWEVRALARKGQDLRL